MWQTLRDNPEVIWGFLLALGVVLVLTPAVGRFARILGVVDQPGESRRLHIRPIPRLGGIALLLGIFVPALAFLQLGGAYRGILLGAAIATCVGVMDDFRGLLVGFTETLSVFNWAILLRPLKPHLPEWLEIPANLAFVPTEYKLVVPFFILVAVLIWRPHGIFRGRVL